MRNVGGNVIAYVLSLTKEDKDPPTISTHLGSINVYLQGISLFSTGISSVLIIRSGLAILL